MEEKQLTFLLLGFKENITCKKKINESGLKSLEIIEKSRVNFMFSSQWDIAVYWWGRAKAGLKRG